MDHFWSYGALSVQLREVADIDARAVSKAPSHEEVLPVIPHSKFIFVHVQHRGLFLLAVVQVRSLCGISLLC